MAFVPGFNQDIFVSYSHADDREWIDRLLDKLEPELNRWLATKVCVWIDEHDLSRSEDFTRAIPDYIRSSAILLILASPSYLASSYCVPKECRVYEATLVERRAPFRGDEFKNQLFVLRCPILPVDNNEHWKLFPGATDIPFCDSSGTFGHRTAAFKSSFHKLRDLLVSLLKQMRNRAPAIALWTLPPAGCY